MKLPVLFLGHGNPMNAIQNTPYAQNWRTLGHYLHQHYGSQIRAILAISAHWQTNGIAVTAMPQPRTIHDFRGFPPALFNLQYPAQGYPELVSEIQALIPNHPLQANHDWGLDHGTWGVLCHLFPEANIPVVQLSLNTHFHAQDHLTLAQQLAPLREQGILIVCSGNIVHNLRLMDWQNPDDPIPAYDWVEHARHLVNHWLLHDNLHALANETDYPPELRLAAPTLEHWYPLLYAVGAAEQGEIRQIFNDDIVGKSLSMTSIIFGDRVF